MADKTARGSKQFLEFCVAGIAESGTTHFEEADVF